MALSASEPNPQLVARRKFRRVVTGFMCFIESSHSSFNGKPKASVFATGSDAFGLPLNKIRLRIIIGNSQFTHETESH
jgi:hypothetical protein